MKYRNLRIAWSAFFGILCLLLIVLWVRSYCFIDALYLELSKSRCLILDSIQGLFLFGVFPRSTMPPNTNWWLGFFELEPGMQVIPPTKFITIPIWSAVLICATLALAPWMSLAKRFSLRTLLIATTLVAVVLGILTISD